MKNNLKAQSGTTVQPRPNNKKSIDHSTKEKGKSK
jgi:hypothetical protein